MNKSTERRVEIGMQYENDSRYVLPKIYVGDTVAISEKAKLQWFAKETRERVQGRIGRVVYKGRYVYTVEINGANHHFSRLDLKKVV